MKTTFSVTHYFEQQPWLEPEVGFSPFIHNSVTTFHGIRIQSSGRKLHQPCHTLSVSLKSAQKLRRFIGKVPLNSNIRTFLKLFKKPLLRRDVILRNVKEVWHKVFLIAQSHSRLWMTWKSLVGACPPLFDLLRTKYTKQLLHVKHGLKLVNTCRKMMSHITSAANKLSTHQFGLYMRRESPPIQEFLKVWHSPSTTSILRSWKKSPYIFGELLVLAKHIGQYRTLKLPYWYDTSMTLRTYLTELTGLSLTTCHSHIGPEVPAYISSMSNSRQLSTSNTPWSRYRLDYPESLHQTFHLSRHLTLPTTASLRRLHYKDDVNDGEYAQALYTSICTMRCECNLCDAARRQAFQ